MVEPRLLCRRHLLGEHFELHMLVGALERGKSVKGFLEGGLVAPQLAFFRHASPLSDRDFGLVGEVYLTKSINDLKQRCGDCFSSKQKLGGD